MSKPRGAPTGLVELARWKGEHASLRGCRRRTVTECRSTIAYEAAHPLVGDEHHVRAAHEEARLDDAGDGAQRPVESAGSSMAPALRS